MSDRGWPRDRVPERYKHQLTLLRSYSPANEAAFADHEFPELLKKAQGGGWGGVGGPVAGFRNPMITVLEPSTLLWRFVPDFDYDPEKIGDTGAESKPSGWKGAVRLSNWFVSGGTIVKLVQKARSMAESGKGLSRTDCLYQTIIDGLQLPPGNRMPRILTVFETRRRIGAFVGNGLTWDHIDVGNPDAVSKASGLTQRGLAQGTSAQIYVPGTVAQLEQFLNLRPPILPIKALLDSSSIPKE